MAVVNAWLTAIAVLVAVLLSYLLFVWAAAYALMKGWSLWYIVVMATPGRLSKWVERKIPAWVRWVSLFTFPIGVFLRIHAVLVFPWWWLAPPFWGAVGALIYWVYIVQFWKSEAGL